MAISGLRFDLKCCRSDPFVRCTHARSTVDQTCRRGRSVSPVEGALHLIPLWIICRGGVGVIGSMNAGTRPGRHVWRIGWSIYYDGYWAGPSRICTLDISSHGFDQIGSSAAPDVRFGCPCSRGNIARCCCCTVSSVKCVQYLISIGICCICSVAVRGSCYAQSGSGRFSWCSGLTIPDNDYRLCSRPS